MAKKKGKTKKKSTKRIAELEDATTVTVCSAGGMSHNVVPGDYPAGLASDLQDLIDEYSWLQNKSITYGTVPKG